MGDRRLGHPQGLHNRVDAELALGEQGDDSHAGWVAQCLENPRDLRRGRSIQHRRWSVMHVNVTADDRETLFHGIWDSHIRPQSHYANDKS